MMKLFSRLLMAMLALCVLGTSCESDVDDVNVVASYTIMFETNGGTTISDLTTDGGSTISVPSTPEKEGYTFENWYLDDTFETLYDFESAVTGDFTLYAKWSVNSYTVSFFTYTDDTENSIADQTVDYGGQVSEPATEPTMEGYEFEGWYTDDATFTEAWDFSTDVMGTEDMVLYAKWEIIRYTVTFYYNNETTDSEESKVDAFDTATAPSPAPTMTGYSLDGWYEAADGSGSAFDFATEITGDVELYANWTINSYEVNFFTYSGDTENSIETQTIVYSAFVAEPAETPVRDGYDFEGWYTDASYETKWDFDVDVVGADDMTLYARWLVDSHTVTFYYNDGTDGSESKLVDITITLVAPTPTKTGYYIEGWYETAECTGEAFDLTAKVTEDVDLYAKWSKNSYTVSFFTYADDTENEIADQTVLFEGSVAEPADPARTGYDFAGWYTDNGTFEDAWDFDADVIGADDMTLYVKWEAQSYEITFYYNDNVTANKTLELFCGDFITAPDEVSTKTGYHIEGWYSDAAFETKWDFDTDIVGADNMSLYANWVIDTYTVTYYSTTTNDYTTLPAAYYTFDVDYDVEITNEATEPTDIAYDFMGWYSDASCATAYVFGAKATGSIELYAKWALKTYLVKFDMGVSSETVLDQTIAYSGTVIEPEEPTSTSTLIFDGWYTDDTYSTEFAFTTQITAETIIYAKWIEIVGTATFYSVGGYTTFSEYESAPGEAIESYSMAAGDLVTAPESEPTTDGYLFAGWYTAENFDNGSAYVFDVTATGDVTLYAKWDLAYTVTFDLSAGSFANDAKTQTIISGGFATQPEDPTMTGADFAGWSYNDEEFDFATTAITSDITIVAEWDRPHYDIATAADLSAFRDAVNNGEAAAATATLLQSITIADDNWVPIGSNGSGGTSVVYTGTFDGGGYTISGLKIDATTAYSGLFGVISNATIKNIKLNAPAVTSTSSSTSALVACDLASSTVEGCTVSSPTIAASSYIASAVVAYALGTTITDCKVVYPTIDATSYIGGIAGYTSSVKISGCTVTSPAITGTSTYVAGVVGYAPALTISNCSVSGGTVTSPGYYLGGVVGGSSSSPVIADCHNYNTSVTKTSAKTYTGGIIGYMAGTLGNCFIINCSNSGTVTSTVGSAASNGGILGCASNVTVIACSNTGTISTPSCNATGGIIGTVFTQGVITGCYNTGDITGASNVAGMAGQCAYAVTVSSCYNAGTITGTGNSGALMGNMTQSLTALVYDCFYTGATTTGIGNDGRTDENDTYGTGTTYISTTASLNSDGVSMMNANETFSATGYQYQAGASDSDLPTLVSIYQ